MAPLNGCVFWQDTNAAVVIELAIPDEKILALGEYAIRLLYNKKERTALEYADAITVSTGMWMMSFSNV